MMETKEPIRVLQVIGIMNRGGAESMIMNLYRNIDRSKVQFDFVENTYEKAAYDAEILALGGRIFNCPHFNGKNYFEYKKWWEDFFEKHSNEYVAIHGHIGSTAAIYLKEAKKKGIYTIAHSHSTNNQLSLHHILYNFISYPTRNIADYFFACSKEAGISRYGIRTAMDTRKYSILNNAIDTSQYAYNNDVRIRIRKEIRAGNNTLVVGHVGRFVEAKNHKFLLSAFSHIHSQKSDSMLLLVGDGALREEIEKQIDDLNLRDSVILTGVKTNVNDYLQAMDVFVFPSLYEGLPVTMVEAQTSGLRCIISDRVPDECIITDNQVQIVPLDSDAKEWASKVLEWSDYERMDQTETVIKRGFDIHATSKWLEDFYLARSK